MKRMGVVLSGFLTIVKASVHSMCYPIPILVLFIFVFLQLFQGDVVAK